ncbi:MAG: hypothetical protein N2378_03820 [Chloroflexaceae bacterium]|nr:hypothetical protein [Chloroflexaceae bacterium]
MPVPVEATEYVVVLWITCGLVDAVIVQDSVVVQAPWPKGTVQPAEATTPAGVEVLPPPPPPQADRASASPPASASSAHPRASPALSQPPSRTPSPVRDSRRKPAQAAVGEPAPAPSDAGSPAIASCEKWGGG